MPLREEDVLRYSRQLIVPEVGGSGQERLRASSVLAIGAGGLGSPSLLYLAAAGVGRIGVVDDDVVDVTNLHRQIAHTTGDLGSNKAASAAASMRAINPDVRVDVHETRLSAANARRLVSGYDLVLDGSDNFATRYLVNDVCVMLGTPFVEAAIVRFYGQLMTVMPGRGPCYRCLFPKAPEPGVVPGCAQAGILGPVAGVLGSLQAIEALKVLLGLEETLVGRFLAIDMLSMNVHTAEVSRDPACAVCGESPTITGLVDSEQGCTL